MKCEIAKRKMITKQRVGNVNKRIEWEMLSLQIPGVSFVTKLLNCKNNSQTKLFGSTGVKFIFVRPRDRKHFFSHKHY